MDTITIVINNYKYESISKIIDGFEKVAIRYNSNGTSTKSGQHKNMLFFITDKCLKITGSITKLIKGSNQDNYDETIVLQAIKYLSNLLEIDVKNAKVVRIDFGFNIKLDYPVSNYLSMLVTPSCSKKFSVNGKKEETIEFRKHNRNLLFYDKALEIKANGLKLSNENQNQNILRYEIKLIKGIAKQFEVPALTFQMLAEKEYYEKLLKIWFNEYLKIDKVFTMLPILNFGGPKEFAASLLPYGIKAIGGMDNALKIVKNNSNCVGVTKYRIIGMLKKYGMNSAVLDSESLFRELDEKIYFIADNAA